MIANKVKRKICAQCGDKFTPDRPMQKVCSPMCAILRVRSEKKSEAASTKARKEKLKGIPELIKEAQRVFNQWVRARDADLPCISCGKPAPNGSEFHGGRDAGHFRSTGAASHLRFHPDNCHAQCVHCNQWKAGNVTDYRIKLIDRIGLERVEAIEHDNNPHRWTKDELRSIKEGYQSRLKELKKSK